MNDVKYFGARTARYGGKVHLLETQTWNGRKSTVMSCGCPGSNNGSGAARVHERFSVDHVNCVPGRKIVEHLRKTGRV